MRGSRTRLSKQQQRLVSVLLGLFVVILANSLLLLLFDASTAAVYLSMVFVHVTLGVLLALPVAVFLTLHVRKMPLKLNRAAARTVHYRFTVPPGTRITTLTAALRYRKFKGVYHRWVSREKENVPAQPIVMMDTARREAGEAPLGWLERVLEIDPGTSRRSTTGCSRSERSVGRTRSKRRAR